MCVSQIDESKVEEAVVCISMVDNILHPVFQRAHLRYSWM